MYHAVLKRTLETLSQPYFLRMILLSASITLVGFALLAFTVGYSLAHVSLFQLEWLDQLFDIAGTLLAVLASWFLFPLLMPLLASFFQEEVADKIDRMEYQQTPPNRLPFWPEFRHAIRAGLLAVGLNLLCLPLYFTVIFFPFVYYGLNGYLLGREFFEMTAARYLGRAEARILRRRFSRRITIYGVGIVLLSMVPVLNLIAPFAGIALMVHLYHAISTPKGRGEVTLAI